MMDTLTSWWRSREPRERLLVALAVVLSLVLGVYQFAWKPAEQFRLRAERAYETALVDNMLVHQATRHGVADGQAETSREPLQTVLTTSAGLYGLTISRLRPAENDGMNLWLDSASPQLLYAWLSELEVRHGVRVGKAALRTTPESGAVSANLYVQRME